MIVACVLKTGGEFTTEHVKMLHKSVKKHNKQLEFYCLSDVDIEGVKCIRLQYDWPKWWGKLELFREFTHQRVLYLDLDTVVIGDISELFRKNLTMLKDVNDLTRFGSGVMAWHGDYSYLYDIFVKDPYKYINTYKTRQNWGDQGFIMNHLESKPESFNFGPLHSYKIHCKRGIPKNTKLVYFHGKPRPWEVNLNVG
ncbi:MAG: hypothetical protein GY861_04010 [bacterium]|nr:hypothetical protein [bacterium]